MMPMMNMQRSMPMTSTMPMMNMQRSMGMNTTMMPMMTTQHSMGMNSMGMNTIMPTTTMMTPAALRTVSALPSSMTSTAMTNPTANRSISGLPTAMTSMTGMTPMTGMSGLTGFAATGGFGVPSSIGGLGSALGGGGNGGGGGSGGGGYGGGNSYGSGQNAGATYLPATSDLLTNEGNNEKPTAESPESRAGQFDRSPRYIFGAGREGRSVWELELAHSLDHPPLVEIYSGRALNTLLKELIGANPTALLSRSSKTLTSDVLGHINLRPADVDGGNPALLKNADHLSWPLVLLGDEYRAARHTVSSLFAQDFQQARTRSVGTRQLTDLQAALDAMREQLSGHAIDVNASDYVQAVRFLYDLSDAAAALDYPEVGPLTDPHLFSQAMTVSELAVYMGAKRLAFAPATPADEAAYDRLYQAMVDDHAAGSRQLALNH